MGKLPLLALLSLAACQTTSHFDIPDAANAATPMRIATFNTSMFSETSGGLIAKLESGSQEARKIAAVIQYQRPDLILLNEFDFDDAGRAADLFQQKYLEVGQFGQLSIHYPYRYLAPVNTGVPSGLDIDLNGIIGGTGRDAGNDAWGYGLHPGQYGMLVLSKYPIDVAKARSFQHLLWKDLPNASAPRDPKTGLAWYPPGTWTKLRLSSKSHWDLPVNTPLGRIHFLVSHPTPPVFDGPEDRNGARNHDEIRFWSEYLDTGEKAWLCDDQGHCGGLPGDAHFVIAGDLNSDPIDGDSRHQAIVDLLEQPRMLRLSAPRSEGAALDLQKGRNLLGSPAEHTASFRLRVDYVLPSSDLPVVGNGVFWPAPGQPGSEWLDATDHRMVWVVLGKQ